MIHSDAIASWALRAAQSDDRDRLARAAASWAIMAAQWVDLAVQARANRELPFGCTGMLTAGHFESNARECHKEAARIRRLLLAAGGVE